MSAVMTSRSMPSLGTKYSFWRLEVGAAGPAGPVLLDMLVRRGNGVRRERERGDGEADERGGLPAVRGAEEEQRGECASTSWR